MNKIFRRAAWGLAAFLLIPALAAGEGDFSLLPVQPLFSPLVANPREPSIGLVAYGNEKGFAGSLGGTLEFLRWRSSPGMEWGLGIFGGIWTLGGEADFSTLLTDDWFSGAYLSGKTGPFSFRFEFQDQKSNLGDAFYSSGEPVYFTRDNQNLTLSLDALRGLRLYAGGGARTWWDDFDPTESQVFLFAGVEVRAGPFSLMGSPCRGYGAYHFKYQDQAGGTFNHAAQLGLQWDALPGGAGLRLAVLYYNGKSEFGEFYRQDDRHWGLGLFFDP